MARYGTRWTVSGRCFAFTVDLAYSTLCRALDELCETETPWEPFDEMADICRAAPQTPEGARSVNIPFRLYPHLMTLLARCKDTCGLGMIDDFLWLMRQVETMQESRSVVDRLGDLGACA